MPEKYKTLYEKVGELEGYSCDIRPPFVFLIIHAKALGLLEQPLLKEDTQPFFTCSAGRLRSSLR